MSICVDPVFTQGNSTRTVPGAIENLPDGWYYYAAIADIAEEESYYYLCQYANDRPASECPGYSAAYRTIVTHFNFYMDTGEIRSFEIN